jgi:Domain of unknown function (DUF4331)
MRNLLFAGPVACLLAAVALVAGCDDDRTAPSIPGPDEPGLSVLLNRPATQMDRFGLPAIATVFIPTAQKDAFNTAQPSGDRAAFGSFVVSKLQAFGHPDPQGLANVLLPDIQPINTAQPSGFLNGRRPQDDVITAELGIIFGSNTALNDDHVDANDKRFLSTFPYLAGPWTE